MESRKNMVQKFFLRDRNKKRIEAIDARKEFFRALVEHTSYNEFESVLDRIETDFYETFKVAYQLLWRFKPFYDFLP